MHVKKNDRVMVITGKSAGTVGRVLVALPKKERVVVEGANIITRHVKPRNAQTQGGRVEQEGAIHVSNVMIMCAKCKRPVRVKHKVEGEGKTRICARCGEALD